MLPLVYDPARVEQEESRVLAEALSGYRERWPEVKVETRTVSGPASRELLRLSDEAQLLVVGSHGRGGFTGLLLGSVSQQILHHSHCPVLMVPRVRRS
jgi:nucleotide-binding universal stress UspA family protein